VIIGDSITEGYGVPAESTYGRLVAKELKGWKLVISGISGSTSASMPGRVKWALKSKPTAMLLALGGNDGLRGLKPEDMKKNYLESVDLAQKEKVKVLVAGMKAPPNYGKAYTDKFAAVFPDLAKEKKVSLFPFLLEGVAGVAKLNLPDGIHPNEAGHKVIAEKILSFLRKELP